MDNKEFLGREPIGRLLLRLALPTVAAQLINMLYNVVDRIDDEDAQDSEKPELACATDK